MVRSLHRPIDVRTRKGQTMRMTYEEYRALPEGVRAEWVDGEAIISMAPTDLHEQIKVLLLRLLSLYSEIFGLGRVYDAGLEMRLLGGRASRLPDVLFVSAARLVQITPERLEGAADLAVEIVSEDRVTRDRRDKRVQYEQAGVIDYWILDPRPNRRRADFLLLGPDRRYRDVLPDAEGRVHATSVPGFWIRPEWIWHDPLPTLIELFEEIAPGVLRVDPAALAERRPSSAGE